MPNKYFVADTNVIVSAAVFSSSNPALSLNKILSIGSLAFSEPVLQEYAEILSGHKFDKYASLETRLEFLKRLIAGGALITISRHIKVCRDPKDDKYLELAAACNAACIVTGDKDLLVLNPFENTPILTPADFLNNYNIDVIK